MDDRWDSGQYKKYHDKEESSVFEIFPGHTFRGDETILDVGCGDGKLTAELAQKLPGAKVVGIDNSPNMIKSARENYQKIPNLTFQEADGTNFSLMGLFDFVFSFRTMHWIEDHHSVFHSVKKVLKPGGKVIVSMGAKVPGILELAFEDVCTREAWASHFAEQEQTYFPATAEKLDEILDKEGFEDKIVETVYAPHAYDSFALLQSWLMCWVPHSTGLPGDQATKFAHDIAENIYRQEGKDMSEGIEFQLPFLYIEAIAR